MTDPAKLGRYELLERIGQGTLGVLYRGRDTLLGREVAVKVMAPGFLDDEGAETRFFREARSAAKLQHVNIVTVFEFGEQDNTPFIAMEFLRGWSLADRLKKTPAMSIRDKLDAGIQLCAGLEAAHKQGVVHRDVKPGNVWVCLDGTVKLLDFGIATAASSGATVVDVLGNPSYMSPEQIAGRPIDARTDIFSAGVVLYEMFAGRRPFDASSPTGVMLKIVNEPASQIEDAAVPAALKTAIFRALEKSPAARYERAADFGRDLKNVKANLPSPRDTATVLIDRDALRKLTAKRQAQRPAQAEAEAPADPVETGTVNTGSPLLIAAVIAVILAALGIIWYVGIR